MIFKETPKLFKNIETNSQQMITRYSSKKSSSSFELIFESFNNNITTSLINIPTIQNKNMPKLKSFRIDSGYISNIHFSGAFDQRCKYNCGAIYFKFETHRQICCFGGKISLPKSTKLPDYICNLLTEKDNEFRNNIRAYNSALSFTSIGYNEDLRLNNNKSMF